MFSVSRKRVFSKIINLQNKYISDYASSVIDKDQKIQVGDQYINYVKVGNGPQHILFIPGAVGTIMTADFKPQIEAFDRNKFTMVLYDTPGYGKSVPPMKTYNLNFLHEDADTAYEFMKTLNIPKFSLVGWCYGSVVSMFLAAKYPGSVNKMVTTTGYSFLTPGDIKSLRELLNPAIRAHNIFRTRINAYGEDAFFKNLTRLVEATENLYLAKTGDLCSKLLVNIQCPTLIINGGKDALVNNVHPYYLHAHIENSSMHLYPEGEHTLHWHHAGDYNRRVQDFLNS